MIPRPRHFHHAWRECACVALTLGLCGLAKVSFAQPAAARTPVPGPVKASAIVPDSGLTTSSSGRFRVLGSSSMVRRMFASQAESAREDYSKLLATPDAGGQPIVIQLHRAGAVSPENASVLTSIEVLAGQAFRSVVHVRLDDGATPQAFRAAIIRTLLVNDIIRGRQPDEIRQGQLVPTWLEVGVIAALEYRANPTRSSVATGVFARGHAFPVEKILRDSPENMTSAGRAAYETSACGLVLLLLSLENGPPRFHRLLSDFAAIDADPAALIRHHFQELAESDKALEKWWALQIARMARPDAADFMNTEDSERRLAQAMLSEIVRPEAEGGRQTLTFLQLLDYSNQPERETLIKGVWLRMRSLTARLHPLFRPLANAQLELIEEAMNGKSEGLPARWVALDEERTMLALRLDGIDDYMNWWEVTRGSGRPTDLENYRKALQPRPAPARPNDPIGAYLDEISRLVTP